jgi:hypothetical protein
VGLKDFRVTRFKVITLRLREIHIRVKVSSWTSVRIWIMETSLPKGLLGEGCGVFLF